MPSTVKDCPCGNELGNNAYTYFGRRFGTYVEAHRSCHPCKVFLCKAFLVQKHVVDGFDLALRANHAQIGRLFLQSLNEDTLVVAVAPGHDDNKSLVFQGHACKAVLVLWYCTHQCRHGEAVFIGKLLPVVQNTDRKVRPCGNLCSCLGYMASACKDKPPGC